VLLLPMLRGARSVRAALDPLPVLLVPMVPAVLLAVAAGPGGRLGAGADARKNKTPAVGRGHKTKTRRASCLAGD
jgi:hypothetical protein